MASTELEELNNAPTPENNVVQYCELTTVGRKAGRRGRGDLDGRKSYFYLSKRNLGWGLYFQKVEDGI